MERYNASDTDRERYLFRLSPEAVEAVARSLYGEDEYDALSHDHQVVLAYRDRARALLKLAADATLRFDCDPKS